MADAYLKPTNKTDEKIIRSITIFDRTSEQYLSEFPLLNVDLHFLQQLVGEIEENPLYDVWPLNENQIDALRPYFTGSIDFERNKYYLEAHSAD